MLLKCILNLYFFEWILKTHKLHLLGAGETEIEKQFDAWEAHSLVEEMDP